MGTSGPPPPDASAAASRPGASGVAEGTPPRTLDPRLADPSHLADLKERWASSRRLRIEDALAPGLARALAEAATARPFHYFERHVNEVRALFWRQAVAWSTPRSEFAPIDALRHLIGVDLPALATAITGQRLAAVQHDEADGVAFDLYTRGSYLDTHTDQGSERLVAYVIGLTDEAWPHEDGGHLEFLAPDESTVLDRIPPGFGTLDLFCIYPLVRPHRVPILTRHVTRLSVNGWLTGELVAPKERP